MNSTIRDEYRRLRADGWRPNCAIHHARVMDSFRTLEYRNLVRFVWEDDTDISIEYLEGDTFDPRHNPDIPESRLDREREEFRERVNREGVYGLVGQYSIDDGETWEHGDSVWGFVGTGENGYEASIASATIEALREALKTRCNVCRKVA